jgi:hypothetical protein
MEDKKGTDETPLEQKLSRIEEKLGVKPKTAPLSDDEASIERMRLDPARLAAARAWMTFTPEEQEKLAEMLIKNAVDHLRETLIVPIQRMTDEMRQINEGLKDVLEDNSECNSTEDDIPGGEPDTNDLPGMG